MLVVLQLRERTTTEDSGEKFYSGVKMLSQLLFLLLPLGKHNKSLVLD